MREREETVLLHDGMLKHEEQSQQEKTNPESACDYSPHGITHSLK